MDWMIQRRLFVSVLTSFFYGVKKKLQYMLWYEIRKKFLLAIFQNTKIFFHFHVYYREAWNGNVNYSDSIFFIFMHQSIPAAPNPPGLLRGICQPCQSRGWGICKFCAVRGPGICQPRGQPWAFDTHAVSCQNITTQRILLEKQADWLICQGRVKIEEVFKGMFSILSMHFFISPLHFFIIVLLFLDNFF